MTPLHISTLPRDELTGAIRKLEDRIAAAEGARTAVGLSLARRLRQSLAELQAELARRDQAAAEVFEVHPRGDEKVLAEPLETVLPGNFLRPGVSARGLSRG
jgi:hypothetical protein